MKQRQAPQISSVLNLLHFGNMLCRFLTLDEAPRVTHCAYKNRTPDSPEAIAGVFSKVQNEREASLAAAAALAEKKYGYVFYYVNAHGHTFGVAVHFPRFESEGIGFLNFHCFDYITAIPAELQFKFSPSSVNQYGVRCKGFNDNAFIYFSPEDGTRITVEPGTHEYPLRDVDSGQTIYVRTFYDSCGCQTAKPFYLLRRNGKIQAAEIIDDHTEGHHRTVRPYPVLTDSI